MKSNGVWKGGVDATNGKNVNAAVNLPDDVDVTDGDWHDLLAVRSGTNWTFYFDGENIGSVASTDTGFFNKVTNPTDLATGYTPKASESRRQPVYGSVAQMTIYSGQLNNLEIKRLSDQLKDSGAVASDLSDAYLTKAEPIFSGGDRGSRAYRIPSLITTDKGTVIAGIDKRNSGSGDGGNIDLVVRRKEKGQTGFDEQIMIFDSVVNSTSGEATFIIDSMMVQDTNPGSPHKGRIHLLVDYANGINTVLQSGGVPGSEYAEIDGKQYRKLYKDGEDQPYVVVENEAEKIGEVYKTTGTGDVIALGEKTDYTVTIDGPQPYAEYGNLYKNGEYKGNIFVFNAGNNHGELYMKRMSSIWQFYSDDDGKTWSLPQNVTPTTKADWMMFFGTGPGRGTQLANGRLVFPIYTTNVTAGGSSQFCTVITSDDFGETWQRKPYPIELDGIDPSTQGGSILTEAQPVTLNDGKVLLFMRNNSGKVKYAMSDDNCESWEWIKSINDVNDKYCQMSPLHFDGSDGKEYIVLSNPQGPNGRENGHVSLLEVQADGTVTLVNKKLIQPGYFAYSCLTELEPAEDGTKRFGDHYEGSQLMYLEFDEKFLHSVDQPIEELTPTATNVEASVVDGKLKVTVTSDCMLIPAGSPKLTVSTGSGTLDLLPESGAASRSIAFSAPLPENFRGVVLFDSMNYESGTISNRSAKNLEVEADLLYDATLVRPASIVSYTSQYSASTAENTDGAAVNIIDGNPRTYWHSHYNNSAIMPQVVTMDLGAEMTIQQMNYLNRQNNSNSQLKDYKVEGSLDGENWTTIIESQMPATMAEQHVVLPVTTTRYIRFSCESIHSGGTFAAIAELSFNLASDAIDRSTDTARLERAYGRIAPLAEKATDAYWATIADQVEEADGILNGTVSATQQRIDILTEALLDAEDAYVPKDMIRALANECLAIDGTAYSAASYAAYLEKVNGIKDGIEQIDNRLDLDTQTMNLRIAKNLLEEKGEDEPDFRPVIISLPKAQEIFASADDYDAESITGLQDKITACQAMLANSAATQDDIDAIASELNLAILSARLLPSAQALEALEASQS